MANFFRFTADAGVALSLAVVCVDIAMAQAGSPPDAPHHLIVPLTSSIGVVSGDPSKAGAPFVPRLANRANQIVPVHWHPEDEHIAVVQGTWCLGSGDKFDRNARREMNVGDYALMPKEDAALRMVKDRYDHSDSWHRPVPS